MHLIRETENYAAYANPNRTFLAIRGKPSYEWVAFSGRGMALDTACAIFERTSDPDGNAESLIRQFWSHDESYYPPILAGIPEHAIPGMMRYVCAGVPTGHFLQAVFAEDEPRMHSKADPINQQRLQYFRYFRDKHAPDGCHGSWEAVRLWTAQGGGVEWKRESQDSPVDAGGAIVDE